MAIEQQQNIDNKEQQTKQELLQGVQNLANQEKDPVKKDLIPKM